MADPFTGAMTPSQIEEGVFQRVGAPRGDSFESWRYNEPAAEGATAYPKSRRKMRMEAEYQQYQASQIKMQSALQAMELARAAEERLQRDQIFQFEEAKTKAEREGRVQDEAGLMIDAMRGAVDDQGNVIANPIRPEDPNAIERLNGLAKEFKYGVENKAAAGMFTQLYNDALKFREQRMKDSEENERLASSLSIRTGRPFEEFGTYDEQGMFQPRMEGVIAAEQEVKAEEEAKQEERVIKTEKRRAETQADVADERNKIAQENKIQQDIRKATEDLRKMNAALSGKKLSETQRNSLTAARDTLIDLEIEKAAIRDLAFADQDAYQKAVKEGKKPPVGTLIYIGRKATKVK